MLERPRRDLHGGEWRPAACFKDLATGAEEALVPGGTTIGDTSLRTEHCSRSWNGPHSNFDIFTLPLTKPGKPTLLLGSRFDEVGLRFSPDERAVAFKSNESGRYEVYVASYL